MSLETVVVEPGLGFLFVASLRKLPFAKWAHDQDGARFAFTFLAIALFFILFVGGRGIAADGGEAQNPPAPHIVVSEESIWMDTMKREASELFAKRDFTGLDEMAERSRKDKRVVASGTSAITVFYRAFPNLPDSASDEKWSQEIDGIEDWIQEKPTSMTARIALAEALQNYAWKARGNGYGEKAPELKAERLAKAHKALDEARRLGPPPQDWYSVAQGVALGERWDKKRVKEMVDEGLKRYPDACAIYLTESYFLQRRWYGQPGEWEAFVTSSADKIGGEDGDILYARFLWYLDSKTTNVFRDGDVLWERAKKGFEVLTKRYPDSLSALSAFAEIACKAEDWETARRLFEKIGGRVELRQWNSMAHFVSLRNEAYRDQ